MTSKTVSFAELVLPLILASLCYGRTKDLNGRVFAFEPISHVSKVASFAENQEILPLQLDSIKQEKKYVKLVVHGFGQKQVPEIHFSGDAVLTLRAKRDPGRDQTSIDFVTTVLDIPQPNPSHPDGEQKHPPNAWKFIVSDHFKNQPLPQLSSLECYSSKNAEEH